jgi:ribosome-associated protein
LELARAIVNSLEEKKGENILLLDIQEVASFTDYFIICSGSSDRMLSGLSRAVRDDVKEQFRLDAVQEGQPASGWVVTDFGDVVVHLFSPDQRDYYKLEELWDTGKVLLRLQ